MAGKPSLRPAKCTAARSLYESVFAALPGILGYPKSRGLVPRAMTSPSLFSGLLKCGEGGANLIIATGGGTHRHKKYACSRRFNRGGCENDLYIRRDDLEDLLLGMLQSEILRPEVVDYAIMEFHRQLETALGSLSDDLVGMRQRKARLEVEVRRLVSAIAESGHSKSLLEEIGRKEAALQGITDGLLAATPNQSSRASAKSEPNYEERGPAEAESEFEKRFPGRL